MIRRAYSATKTWFTQTGRDLKESADAGLLGSARFLGLLYGPIDRRLHIDQALKKALRYKLPKHAGWRHAPGGITYVLFMVLVVTGVLLALYYRPSVQEAYASVQHIVSNVSFGWLIRDLHVWAASLIVIAMMLHMARVLFEGAYKPPRETNWTIGLLLLFVVLGFGATGYLLPWDQWAYWTVTEVLVAVASFPIGGNLVAEALMGDVIVSGATLSRFFSIHVIVLPWASLALLAYHFTLVRRRGIAPPIDEEETKAGVGAEDDGIPFWPDHLLRSFIVTVLVLAVTISLAALFPRPVGAPANPGGLPHELVSTWVPVDVSLALLRYLGIWGFVGFTLLGVSFALIPLFDRKPERHMRKRPVVVGVGLLFFVGFIALWLLGRQIGSLPPSADLGEARAGEQMVPAERGTVVPRLGPEPHRPQADPEEAAGERGTQ